MKFSRFEPFKILAHSDKLKVLAQDGICAPVQWMVYPSNVCNFNCDHCIMKSERKNCEMLPEVTMKKMVADVVRVGSKCVMFAGGGEPLTNPCTLSTMETLKSVGVEVGMLTNGILLPEKLDINYLRISVDAATKETYWKVKGVDAWDRLNHNLRRLKFSGELGLAFLVEPANFHEIEDFCQWAQQWDYKFIHIRPAYWPEKDQEIRDGVAALGDIKSRLSKYRDVNFITSKFDSYWGDRTYDTCRATPLKAVLCADGRFAVCQDVFIKFGDYNRMSFESCWYSEEHRNALKSIDLSTCPRCVENGHNEIIEHCIKHDSLKVNLI